VRVSPSCCLSVGQCGLGQNTMRLFSFPIVIDQVDNSFWAWEEHTFEVHCGGVRFHGREGEWA
jgi:hypothetical protein